MSRVKKMASSALNTLSDLTYASTPYIGAIWSAVSTGNILEASPLALAATAKEHHFQYKELIKDTERASSYVNSVGSYIKYLESKAICNIATVKKAYKELFDLVKTLHGDRGIRQELDAQQISLNNTLEEYKETHNVNKYISKVNELSEKMFVKSWPGWYRVELNSHINRMNILLDESMMHIENKDKCTIAPKLKPVSIPEPVELEEEEEAIFYDSLQKQQQSAGGNRKTKKKPVARKQQKKQ
jgi:hypothetical protein